MVVKSKPLKLAVLISGSGSNLQAIIDACKGHNFPAQIEVVLSNTPDAYGLERAKAANIDAHVINHKNFENREAFDEALLQKLSEYGVDLICLAGFMRILTADFVHQWPNKIINTHPSLLPKHGGKGMYGEHVHKAVLAANDDISGCSIHYVVPEVDQGPVIIQKQVPVMDTDTADTLAQRVIAQEHIAYVEAISKIALERGNN